MKKNFLRFSGIGIQMGVTILLCALLGDYLDKKQNNKTPWWTVGLTLFGVISSMYILIKELKKLGDEK